MPTLERLAVFNPRPQIERLLLLNGQFCYVIDEALVDPDALVQFAVANRAAFSSVNFSPYPGHYLEMPAPIAGRLNDFFAQHARRAFDAHSTLHVQCRLSLVTLPPQALRPYQSICHTDGHVEAGHNIQASVLYLFKDESLGGTSFYEPVRSALETARLFRDAGTLSSEAFTRNTASPRATSARRTTGSPTSAGSQRSGIASFSSMAPCCIPATSSRRRS